MRNESNFDWDAHVKWLVENAPWNLDVVQNGRIFRAGNPLQDLHLGEYVFDIADPRHVGEVIKIDNNVRIDVRWIETGWISEGLDVTDLHRVPNWEVE